MALSLRLIAITGPELAVLWTVDSVGWRPYGLRHDPRFRLLPSSTGYADYAAVLSVEEVITIMDTHVKAVRAEGLPGARDQRLEEKLNQHRDKTIFVIAHIYEWESGLGD